MSGFSYNGLYLLFIASFFVIKTSGFDVCANNLLIFASSFRFCKNSIEKGIDFVFGNPFFIFDPILGTFDDFRVRVLEVWVKLSYSFLFPLLLLDRTVLSYLTLKLTRDTLMSETKFHAELKLKAISALKAHIKVLIVENTFFNV